MSRTRIFATATVAIALGLTGSAVTGQSFAAALNDGAKGPFTTVQAETAADPLTDPAVVLDLCAHGPETQHNFGWAQSQGLIDEGWNHAFNERGEEAIAAFVTAINVGPERPEPYWGLGVAAYVAGLDDAVIDACFARTIAMLPDVAAVQADYGNVLSLRERWDEAIAAYEAAIALDDTFIHAYDGLSAALLAIGDQEGAQAAHDRSWELRGY